MTDPLTRERVEEIRKGSSAGYPCAMPCELTALCDAFLALEDARAENARLREALNRIGNAQTKAAPLTFDECVLLARETQLLPAGHRRARAALE